MTEEPELLAVGDIVKTNYATGPYRVAYHLREARRGGSSENHYWLNRSAQRETDTSWNAASVDLAQCGGAPSPWPLGC